MQQEARYTPVDTGQRRRKSSSGVPEHNARSNCFYIPNFNIILYIYIYIYCNKLLLLFVVLCGRRDFASHDSAAAAVYELGNDIISRMLL